MSPSTVLLYCAGLVAALDTSAGTRGAFHCGHGVATRTFGARCGLHIAFVQATGFAGIRAADGAHFFSHLDGGGIRLSSFFDGTGGFLDIAIESFGGLVQRLCSFNGFAKIRGLAFELLQSLNCFIQSLKINSVF